MAFVTLSAGNVYFDEVSLAERWNLSRRTLQQWRYRGTGPDYAKIGGAVRYPLNAVEQYERERTLEPLSRLSR